MSNSKVRCFRRSVASYSDHLVHEGVEIHQGEILMASGHIHHNGEWSHETKVFKINQYSSLKSQEIKCSLVQAKWRMLLIFPWAFFRSFCLKRQFLNGFHGFSASMVNAFYAYLKAAKCYERLSKIK